MTIIARLTVAEDGSISADTALPAGHYVVKVQPPEPGGWSIAHIPTHASPHWDESLSLRREDMYGDDSR